LDVLARATEIARVLRAYAVTLPGREQLAAQSFGEAIKIVPLTLGENAGIDSIDVLSELRARHEKGEKRAGFDVFAGKIGGLWKLGVYEPLAVKRQIIKSATEAAKMLLGVDDAIAAGKTRAPPMPPGGPGGMPGGGYDGMPLEYWVRASAVSLHCSGAVIRSIQHFSEGDIPALVPLIEIPLEVVGDAGFPEPSSLKAIYK